MKKRLTSIFFALTIVCLLATNVWAEGDQATSTETIQPETSATEESEVDSTDSNWVIIGQVIADNVNLMSEPTKDSVVLAELPRGTVVDIVYGSEVQTDEELGVYIQVTYNDLTGYIPETFTGILEKFQGEMPEWELISTATTKASANANRDTNIAVASNLVNNTILSPGEKFSFWGTVGKCTYDKGYKDATVYSNGKKTTGIGGGVCQVSTTINMAVKAAGIETKARQHSLPVSYASREDEATVSYGNVDFSFVNTTGKNLQIRMYSANGECTCEIWEVGSTCF